MCSFWFFSIDFLLGIKVERHSEGNNHNIKSSNIVLLIIFLCVWQKIYLYEILYSMFKISLHWWCFSYEKKYIWRYDIVVVSLTVALLILIPT